MDLFDPICWTDEAHEFRIYSDNNAQQWTVVDEIDYHWAIEWCWCINVKKSRRNPLKTKSYLRRAVGENSHGQRLRTSTLYLHIEIMRRTNINPPSMGHCIVDHRDGDTFNCRRNNLRWATHSMNSKNIFGKYPYDLEELMS